MPLHVLQLGPYPPPEGGVSRNMLAIRDGLVRAGAKCSIIATSRSLAPRDEENVYHPSSAAELLKLLFSIDFDVLHLHVGGDIDRRILSLAAAATAAARRKSVLTVHSGAFPLSPEAKAARSVSLRGLIFRQFGRLIAVNDDLADVFKRFGVAEDRIRKVLPFALTRPDPAVGLPDDIRELFQAHSPILLSVGGLEPDYDPILQIRAMESIVYEMPKAGLIMVGDGSMRDAVHPSVSASSAAPNIYLAGNVDHAVTLHLIERADVLLRTTLFDGDAISIREALFLGTPVIATDNGMRPDGVHLMPVGDTAKLIELIREITSKPKERRDAASADVSNIDRVIELYHELI